jgi:hypothetical protein
VAQGTAAHVEVPLKRFLSAEMEDGRDEERLRSIEQATMGFATIWHSLLPLLTAIGYLEYAAAFFLLGGH